MNTGPKVAPKSVELSSHAGARAFVNELECLLHPAPVGPCWDYDEMLAHAEALAAATPHLRPALLALCALWQAEGNFRAEPLEWVLELQQE